MNPITDDPVSIGQDSVAHRGKGEAVPTVVPISDADTPAERFNKTYDENARRRGQYPIIKTKRFCDVYLD